MYCRRDANNGARATGGEMVVFRRSVDAVEDGDDGAGEVGQGRF